MKEFWTNHKKTILIVVAVIGILALVGAGLALALLGKKSSEEPKEVTSAWPVAERERTVTKPPEPVRWPLTGVEVAPGESPADVRVLSVKIENSAAARPQTGLDMADIVYESLTEGGITRFNALFHSQTPPEIGPVRSARMSDTQLVPQYSALFAHSGANSGVLGAIRSTGLEVVDHSGASAAYRRVSDRRAPHNLYMDPARAREIAISRGYSATQELKGLQFSPSAESTLTVSRVVIPFSNANSVAWDYNADRGVYQRSNNGQAHKDRVSGEQYSAHNVVVLWTRTTATGPRGIGGRTLEIALVGNGRASIFRDGIRIDGVWETDGSSPPVFRDDEGALARLAPGNTWFQVVPLNVNISMQ
ncbi:MAG: DUF3048 domain-containing protein [Coriobacteriia bacterium]|nr:DUF3048 domain-containing protein [Coriobacteriia bacterium]